MGTLDQKTNLIVNVIIADLYPVLFVGVAYPAHYTWRLKALTDIRDGVIDETLTTRWLRTFIDKINDAGLDDGNPFTKSEVFNYVITHLEKLTAKEIEVKIKAFNGG